MTSNSHCWLAERIWYNYWQCCHFTKRTVLRTAENFIWLLKKIVTSPSYFCLFYNAKLPGFYLAFSQITWLLPGFFVYLTITWQMVKLPGFQVITWQVEALPWLFHSSGLVICLMVGTVMTRSYDPLSLSHWWSGDSDLWSWETSSMWSYDCEPDERKTYFDLILIWLMSSPTNYTARWRLSNV